MTRAAIPVGRLELTGSSHCPARCIHQAGAKLTINSRTEDRVGTPMPCYHVDHCLLPNSETMTYSSRKVQVYQLHRACRASRLGAFASLTRSTWEITKPSPGEVSRMVVMSCAFCCVARLQNSVMVFGAVTEQQTSSQRRPGVDL